MKSIQYTVVGNYDHHGGYVEWVNATDSKTAVRRALALAPRRSVTSVVAVFAGHLTNLAH